MWNIKTESLRKFHTFHTSKTPQKESFLYFIYISYYLEFQIKSSAVLSLLTKINY